MAAVEPPRKYCIAVVGPTAVGKTNLALELAHHFNTSIISFDSRQCYRELNIGVAKPSPAELSLVPHYFINSHDVTEEVNAADFADYANRSAEAIFADQDVLIMVGGTGLYLNAFENGMDDIPAIDAALRENLRQQYAELGLDWLQAEIRREDPLFQQTQNPQRTLRALEVKLQTGRSITELQKSHGKKAPFQFIKIGLELPREELYQRINKRVDLMMDAGLESEVRSLVSLRQLNALNTVGYKELFGFMDGECTIYDAVNQIKQNTRRYAKRQLTWFRRDPQTYWFSPQDIKQIKETCIAEINK